MEELRKRIDSVDEEILKLILERVDIAENIGNIKRERGLPIKNQERENAVLEHYAEYARDNGLDETVLIDICRSLIKLALQKES